MAAKTAPTPTDAEQTLRRDGMMTYLLDSLDSGKDIGHYGRLVFTMVARHFMDEKELVRHLSKDRDFDEEQAQSLVAQVIEHDYNPPRREKILEFQSRQEFPILPDSDDPDVGNVYRDLTFPDHVYDHIKEYYDHKT